MSVCASVQLEMHRPENMNKITDVRALTLHYDVLHLILYLTLFLYMMENMHVFIWEVVRSISRLIHGIARQMGASN